MPSAAIHQSVKEQCAIIEFLESRTLLAGMTSLAVGPILFTAVSGNYLTGSDLYRSNLDGSNKVLLQHWESPYDGPSELFGFHGKLFFSANYPDEDVTGPEPWVSDGTPGGTHMIADLYEVAHGSYPHDWMVANDHLFFQADNGSHSDKVFVTDGMTATQLLEPPYGVEPFQPLNGVSNVVATSKLLYADLYYYDEPRQVERWQTNGTVAGTRLADPTGVISPNGNLRIFGTNNNDTIRLTTRGQTTYLTINGKTQRFNRRSYNAVEVHGLRGDDSILLDDSITAPARIFGNSGRDYIRGGGGDDVIQGPDDLDTDHDTVDGGGGNDHLYATAFSLINGGDGNDTIEGGTQVTVNGGSGDDRFLPWEGFEDLFNGGQGNDTIDISVKNGNGQSKAIMAGAGKISEIGNPNLKIQYASVEGLLGTDENDQIFLANNDSIRFVDGQQGNDTIIGGLHAETLIGGIGDDSIAGSGGDDLLAGDDGADWLDGGTGGNTVVGGAADADTVVPSPWNVSQDGLVRIFSHDLYVVGTPQDDSVGIGIAGVRNRQLLVSFNQRSYQFSSGQLDSLDAVRVSGIGGDDLITVARNIKVPSTLLGNAGDDTITPGGSDDFIDGGDGNDTFDYSSYTTDLEIDSSMASSASGGRDVYHGMETLLSGSGNDSIGYYSFSGITFIYVDGGRGDDRIFTGTAGAVAPTVHGGEGSDSISISGTGTRYLFGDDGNDFFEAAETNPLGPGQDFNGGTGIDAVYYRSGDWGVHVTIDNLPDDGANGGAPGHDNVHTDIEVVSGGFGDDTIIGSDNADTLFGGGGADLIMGNGGDDWINFYSDYEKQNTINGGAGRDVLNSYFTSETLPDVLITDPDDLIINQNVIQIYGTGGDDVINITKPGDPTMARVTINGTISDVLLQYQIQPYNNLTFIRGFNVITNGGIDQIIVDPNIKLPVTIDG